MNHFKNRLLVVLFTIVAAIQLTAASPVVGGKAPDFTLKTPEGKSVQLYATMAKSPVVLVVLRGYPGYQCPFCNRQVQEFIQNSKSFIDAGVHMILVYPGPPQELNARANEFLVNKKLPDNFDLVLDPGYEFTNLYGLRWNADKETAYPSAFILDTKGIVFFSKISREHGGRATSMEITDALSKHKAMMMDKM